MAWRAVHVARSIKVGEAWNRGAGVDRAAAEGLKQVLHGEFAFTEHDILRASLEVFEGIGSGLRAADNGLPSGLPRYLEDFDDIAASHQVRIDTDDGWGFSTEMLKEGFATGEGGIEYVDVVALVSEMGT
jgi:hypothetical protein